MPPRPRRAWTRRRRRWNRDDSALQLALIPSPYVGAIAWAPAAAELSDAVAVDYGGVRGPEWFEGTARRIAARMDASPWVAVLHSGAGAFAPSLADVSAKLKGFVFVDAGLPRTGISAVTAAPEAFIARLRERTDMGGLLAPWSTWFDEDPTVRMIPDATMRQAFVLAQPRVPFAFLEQACAGSDAWSDYPAAFLQLSRTYAADADKAERLGWPVERHRAHHLAMASDPSGVAAAIQALVTQLAN